jgi:hypothetical protein
MAMEGTADAEAVDAAKAAEAEACIGSIRMHWKSTEADGADRATVNTKCQRWSKRTCQNSLGQDGTHLGLLLLHVGPNGDRFGGQAFMEHYSTLHSNLYQPLSSSLKRSGNTMGHLG